MPKTTFTDVAGADEAVEELDEIQDFLPNPARYQALGAKIPKGVLLYGPPGTGKTLLARAVAGEAGVPFYTISGSDFVEMFVGVGASRVRDLFEQAKPNSPVHHLRRRDRRRRPPARRRHGRRPRRARADAEPAAGRDGRLRAKGGIILIAATNRPDILDPALLRPGRFDRQIPVGQPGPRRAARRSWPCTRKGKPFAPDVDFTPLAKRTVGMSGADLANVINEAALLTARENGTVITGAALEESVDRVVGGPRRKGRIISEQEKKITAYHEGGHALAAWAMPDLEPVYKVTILPRGRTGGHALVGPRGRQGPDDPLGDDRPAGDGDGRARRRGAGVRRADHRRVLRHRPGHQDRPRDGHRIRHERPSSAPSSTAPSTATRSSAAPMGTQPDYSHRGRARDRRRGARAHRGRAHRGVGGPHRYRDVLDTLAGELLEKETLHREELEVIFADVEKRPRITTFDDFGGRVAVGQAADQDPRRAGHRARRAVAAAGARAGVQGRDRRRPPEAAERAGRGRPNGSNGANGSHHAPGNGPGTVRCPPRRPRSPTTAPRPVGTRPAGRRSQPPRPLVSAGPSSPPPPQYWPQPPLSAVSALPAAPAAAAARRPRPGACSEQRADQRARIRAGPTRRPTADTNGGFDDAAEFPTR